jgi:DNA-binding GntR family transcriptional regulator
MPESPTTLSSSVYSKLRRDIIAGALSPGRKLRIEEACVRTGATSTPVREALNQLAVEGFVARVQQRGFMIADVSAEELAELTDTRCWVEAIALRESIAHRSVDWEERLVLTFHRLARTERSTDSNVFQDNPAWEDAHRAFHLAMIAACPSRFLIDFCLRLSDHAVRYRRLAMSAVFPRRDIAGEHRMLMEAAMNGRVEDAVAGLIRHYRITAGLVLQDSPAMQGEPTP